MTNKFNEIDKETCSCGCKDYSNKCTFYQQFWLEISEQYRGYFNLLYK